MTTQIGIYDHLIGEQIVREMTDDELVQRDIEIKNWLIEKEKRKAEAEQLRQIKISAYEKLGLTTDEIAALVPTPQPRVLIAE